MELLFVTLGGAILGLAAHYALPLRHTRGVALVPAIGTAVAGVVWVALTWLGWAWDGGWIWVVSLVAAGLVAGATAFLNGPRRDRADTALFERLARPGVARAEAHPAARTGVRAGVARADVEHARRS